MNKEQTEKYIERLGLDSSLVNHNPDRELLDIIQFSHVTTVPYENLDILSGIPLRLDESSLYAKIVERHRGGYCFEVNASYNYLLNSLGYNTLSCFARFLRGEKSIPKRRHRILIVDSPYMDGRYFADVGIGQKAPRVSLKLEEGLVQEQYGEVYRFEKDKLLGWVLCELCDGKWGNVMAFTEEPQLETDYITTSFYCEKHPDSPFNKGNMLAIKTETGRITISNYELRIFDGNHVTVKAIENDDEFKHILDKFFGIRI